MISKEQLMLMNSVIAQLYMNPDFDDMRKTVMEMLQTLIPAFSITFFLAEEGGSNRCARPMCIGGFENEPIDEYVEIHQDNDHSKWLFTSGKSIVYRETDYFSEEVLNASLYYNNVYVPNKIKDSIQMAIGKNSAFLGVVTFFRRLEDRDFSDDEILILEALIEHFENRLFYEIVENPEHDRNASFGFGVKSEEPSDQFDAHLINTLTRREKEIFNLLTEGKSIDELKDICCISESTLRKHIQNIYQKLNVHSRYELAKIVNRLQ